MVKKEKNDKNSQKKRLNSSLDKMDNFDTLTTDQPIKFDKLHFTSVPVCSHNLSPIKSPNSLWK